MVDPYAATHSRRFDIVRPSTGGILFVAQDTGDILNPLNIAKDQIMIPALRASYYQDVYKKLLERVKLRLDRAKAKNALDKRVNKILANDAEYQRFLKWSSDERRLRKPAQSHMDYLFHGFWAIKNLASIGTPEPRTGKYDQESHDRWINHIRHQPKTTVDAVNVERKKLDNVFKDAQKKRMNRKASMFHLMAG